MWRFGYDTTASFLLTIALLSMLAAVIVWQQHRSGRTIVVWLWAGIFGILLGCSGTFAMAKLSKSGLWESQPAMVVADDQAGGEHGAEETGEAGGGTGGGMGGGGMFGGPRPKRDLTQVVRKVALLTGEVGIELSADQGTALLAALNKIETAESMSDEEAQAKQDEILALLDGNQKKQLEAIALPRGARTGGDPGGEPPAEGANPFGEETNSEALGVLRQRFAGPQE